MSARAWVIALWQEVDEQTVSPALNRRTVLAGAGAVGALAAAAAVLPGRTGARAGEDGRSPRPTRRRATSSPST
jgi:hypothetical protein